MKHGAIAACLFLITSGPGFAATHIIQNSGFTFAPDTLTINSGDTVDFIVNSIHVPREVSLSTWNAQGTTSNGGFDLQGGGGIAVLTTPGTHYYVCVNHVASMNMKGRIFVLPTTGVAGNRRALPTQYALSGNFPNPFNPTTKIEYQLPAESKVKLTIFDLRGATVATLVDQVQTAGERSVEWNAGENGSGVYFYKLEAVNVIDPGKAYAQVRKMLLIR